jgi:glycine cleavage system H lipoate-binding protein
MIALVVIEGNKKGNPVPRDITGPLVDINRDLVLQVGS